MLSDLIVFSFLALIGELFDSICQAMIVRAREERIASRVAERNADEIKRVLSGWV